MLSWWCTEASGELPVHKKGCEKCTEEPVQLMQLLVSRYSLNSSHQAHEHSCLGRHVLLRQLWGFLGYLPQCLDHITPPASPEKLSLPQRLQTLNDSKVTKPSSHMTNSNAHQTLLGPAGPNSSLPVALLPTSSLGVLVNPTPGPSSPLCRVSFCNRALWLQCCCCA